MNVRAVRVAQRTEQERPRVLVVDDDGVVLALLRDTLSRHFDVLTADSGESALTQLQGGDVAVLLADQRMPGMTGVQLASRARETNPDLVTILLSAYTDPQEMMAAINEGQVFRFLQKPWDTNDLVLTLHQAAERYRLSRDNARLLNELERRLRALEVLQEVAGAVAAGSVDHPASVLLDRLADVVLYDLAAVILVPERGAPATLEVRGRRPVSEQNAVELWEQMLEIYQYFAGASLPEERVRPRIAVTIDPRVAPEVVGSQVQVPLRLEDRVAGVLTVQSFKHDAYPKDVARLLDLLANGTADAVARVQHASHRKWRLLEQIWRAAPDGMVLCGPGGDIQMANHVARRLFDGDDLAETLWPSLHVSPDEVRAARATPIERALTIGSRSVRAKLWSVQDDGALDLGIVISLRDVSDFEAQEGERRAFFSTMSHEIRTPLVSITAAIDLLLDGGAGELNERQQRYVGHADKACRALNQLVDTLIDLERFSQSRIEIDPQPTDLAALSRDVLARFEPAAEEARLHLVLECADGLPVAPVEGRRAEQVLSNLLGNAMRFASPGSAVRVTLESSREIPGWLVMGVHNVGSLIAPDELDVIFERFRQGRGAHHGGERSSSGLGLPISRGIVEAHGGVILAESSAAGTSFWIAWPTSLVAERGKIVTSGPLCWVDASDVTADRMAAAALLARGGFRVRLLPAEAEAMAAARAAAGVGLIVTVGKRSSSVVGPHLVWTAGTQPTFAELAQALRVMSQHRARVAHIDPRPPEAMLEVLEALGLRVAATGSAASALTLVGAEGVGPARLLLLLASQLGVEAEAKAPVCAFVQQRRRMRDAEAFGIIRLDHLKAYRAAYGVAREALVRQALHDLLERVLRQRASNEGIAWVGMENGALFAGTVAFVDEVLVEVGEAFPAMVRLHYRKQDREQGFVEVAGAREPLVSVTQRRLAVDDSEAEVLGALGLETPCVWRRS